MSQLAYFNLPDVGEGLTEAEIVTWMVKPGDTVGVNQIICEIETAKSLVELPCPFAGTITQLMANEGDTVEVGKPIIAVTVADGAVGASTPGAPAQQMHTMIATNAETAAAAQAAQAAAPVSAPASTDAPAVATPVAATEEKAPANLVGYGVSHAMGGTRRRGRTVPGGIPAPAAATAALPIASAQQNIVVGLGEENVIAKPPTRALAKELNVDITKVTPTGLAGEVTREDVVNAAQQASVFRNLTTPDAPSERETRIPVKGVRKAIANAMVTSAFQAPHVSIFVDVDATRTMEYVKRLKASTDFAGVKVTPLLIMAKAMMWAVRRNPMVNATFTDEEIIVHNFVNFGIAAATPRGLIVPNIKDADQMSMLELAKAIEQLATTAREGKTQPAEMQNGTITITNIGVFGVDTGTPILNPGECAIVALGSIRPKPWVVNNEIQVRQVTTIGATFDHRVVDGDVASRFVQDVASVIEEPALLLD
ncbi:MAG: 2-oxo acid dehydrogenase subunit E2 [Actinomycetales bacterium]|nr:2-oxo acid dehydrogenase subunit E2 [Actinomycetales bacterium]